MRLGNCLIFAILLKLALGGRIASEPSKYGWWRHYWWESPCGRVRAEFNPPTKRSRWLPPPVFRGAVTVTSGGVELGANPLCAAECAQLGTLRDGHPQ